MLSKPAVHAVFWIICGSLTAYTTILQFIKYFENADTPIISFKEFNQSPDDVYPDVTLCFDGSPLFKQLYDNFYLKKHHSISKSEYQNLLSGDVNAWRDVSNASRVADVDFDKVTPEMKDLIVHYYVGLADGISNLTGKQLMHKTYQIPGKVCYTRNFGSHLKNTLVTLERFRVSLTNTMVTVFVHYPGQMLRTIYGVDRIYKSAFTMTADKMNSSNNFEVKMAQMAVLKRRPDAVTPCDPNPTDDARFWNETFSRLTCIPAYWKIFAPANSSLKDCNNFKQFVKVQNMTHSLEQNGSKVQLKIKESILSAFTVPCNEMGISVTSETMPVKKWGPPDSKDISIRLVYNMQKYQEIKNQKAFGKDSVLSYTGGFVGLFVGCCLLSLLDDAYDLITYYLKKQKNSN